MTDTSQSLVYSEIVLKQDYCSKAKVAKAEVLTSESYRAQNDRNFSMLGFRDDEIPTRV